MRSFSPKNQRPWHFVVITDQTILTTRALALANVSPYALKWSTMRRSRFWCGDLERELAPGFWVQDCAAATENLLLEAEDRRLGAVWVGIYPRDIEWSTSDMCSTFLIPSRVAALVPIGHPAEEKRLCSVMMNPVSTIINGNSVSSQR